MEARSVIRKVLGWGAGNVAWLAVTKLATGAIVSLVTAMAAFAEHVNFAVLIVLCLAAFVGGVWAVNGVVYLIRGEQKGALGLTGDLQTKVIKGAPRPPPDPAPEPHDPAKDYTAEPRHVVFGEGRYRVIQATLHHIGDGWDSGVHCEVVRPSGAVDRLGGWNSLDNPGQRRKLRDKGQLINAEEGGPYEIRWVSNPRRGFAGETVVTEALRLGPTGPRDGWLEGHEGVGDLETLSVSRTDDGVAPLQGFRCEVSGPGGYFVADDRERERMMGLIGDTDYPLPKDHGSFAFPRDFADAPELIDLKDGDYEVLWTAWEPDDLPGAGPFSYRAVDVARDALHVDRDGNVA